MAGRITFLRHAESAANAGLKTASNAEGPLSDKGYAQAAAFAERMAKPPDLLLVSPFRRTLETAAPIRERFPSLPCEVRDGLHEFVYLSPARFNGTDASQRAPAIADYWAAMDPRRCDGPDAESFASSWDGCAVSSTISARCGTPKYSSCRTASSFTSRAS